jgi:predicted O-linked N-acetylglucosamine transferase (SPINDLY family)
LQELKRFEDALFSYYKAISIKHDFAEAYYNCGNTFLQLRQLGEAIVNYDKAIKNSPSYLEPYINRGIALQELNRFEEALINYDKAISIKNDYGIAYHHRSYVLQLLKRLDEALDSYNKAYIYDPDINYLIGDFQHIKMLMCNWDHFYELQSQILEKINLRFEVCVPFAFLALIGDPAVQKISSEIYAKERYPINNTLGSITKISRQKKIRVGYYSADFNYHAVSFLTAELFELHNREQFEIIALYYGVETKDEMHERLTRSFDQFIYARNMSDQEVAKLSRKLQIDIAIDLGGFTRNSRTGIFSYRAAPIQLSYLGYLGTMGVEYFDYLIADRTIIPEDLQQYYTEKIIYLPSYQVNDRKRIISQKEFTRYELGLPDNAFVFCCFNNNYKILPTTFDGWMRILKVVEGSVLFLYADNQWAEQNLKKEAIARDVEPYRLVFGNSIAREDYLARYKCCDLFLDTFPYNAGTTASDSLWAGLPVLTLKGVSFASRVASSILNAIHLPELIASSQAEYEALAIELATNPKKLLGIKEKLIKNRLATPLFDTPLFTKHIENAYIQIMERYQADLPTEHMYISNIN